MSADIFISFASQDAKTASTICTAIESRGFTCWISTRDILPGENFQSAIVRAIRGAKVLLLVFTANSNRSDEMTKELALASQQKLMVVPLRVENVTPSDAFAYEFATRQWIDLFADWEQAMNHLGTRLSAALADDRSHVDTIVLGKPSLQDPVAKAKLSAARWRRARIVGATTAAVALVGAAGVAMPRLFSKSADTAATPATTAPAAEAVAQAPAVTTANTIAAPAVPAPEVTASPPPAAVATTDPAAVAPTAVAAAPEAPPAPKPVRKPSRKASSNLPY